MDDSHPDWESAFIVGKVNQYYFTGTMQDGLLIIKRNRSLYYIVRRSYERAEDESPLDNIHKMENYRDAALIAGAMCGNAYFETEIMTIAIMERIRKYFKIDTIGSLDKAILSVRAVKSPYELHWIETSGKLHNELLLDRIPYLLKEGMSEADFVAEIFREMVKSGYQGISRFSMFQTEMVVGQVGFGVSSIYPTCFDGPGGSFGMCPPVPLLGSREKKLKKGDLVFADIAFGVNGYHSDKTQVYMFGGKPTDEIQKVHKGCIAVQSRLAGLLKPGAIPSDIYNSVMDSLDDDFKNDFMGFGSRKAKFLGHGVGLHIDELPVIANGFKDPLAENMVIALEPKKGIANTGMVGVEDTYVVTKDGGRCITGGGRDIIVL
ncbi:MAG: M24 family metallopeptidase [Saccharofermentanales bacterium]